MPASSQQSGPDSRFQHLLQPIRDLTKNWNVDIASQLDEYLAEIEQISISFDGGTTTMNFAEAALLIQGSACVYSKKVEYLCSLVHEVLGSLASRKKAQAAREENAEGQEDDHAADTDKDEEFLDLDDMQEMKNIDAKTNAADLTQGTIQNIPKTPLALIPLEETEKEGEPLLSRAGEVIASRSDFNMNLGHLHPLGVILLDMSHLSLLEHSIRSKPSSTPFVPRTGVVVGEDANDAEDENPVDAEVPLNNISMDDGSGGGCDMPEDVETVVQEEAEGEQRYCLRENARTRHQVAPPTRQPVEAWQPLNPHTSSNTTEKPFRKGRTSRLPPSLKKAAERKRKRKNDGEEKTPHCSLPSIADFCTQAFYSYASKYPSNPLKVPSYPEFEHLFLMELHRRQTQAKQDRRRLMQEEQLRQLAVEDEAEEMEVHADVFDDDVDTGDADTGDAAGDDFVDVHLPLPIDTEMDRPETILETETAVVSSFEDMVLNHVEGYLASAQQYVQTTELSRRVSEWAEKIVPRLGIEEKRNTFDIHKYGTSVLERLTESEATQSDPWVPFSKVVETEPQYEVCRMLLASLQLANSSNVDISCDSDFDHTVNSLKLKFLTMRRHHEDLADYRAPSAHV